MLRDAAERAGGRAPERLAQVRAVLDDDLVAIDRELARLAQSGVSPATDAAMHLLEAGGKRVRPLTVMLSAACFAPPPARARDLAISAELVHLATLLHDDVIDDGQERRGRPTSRRVWGNAVSVLAGDLLLTHALERTAAVALPGVLADLFATLRRLVDGEVVQLRGRTALDVREETYLRIVRDKTAALFAWAGRAGARAADAGEGPAAALGEFAERVGVAFQLVDDVLDYSGDPQATGKTLLADLVEGKITLPLIYALADRPVLLRDVEAVREGDDRAAQRVAEAVVHARSCDGVRAMARQETSRALEALGTLAPTPAREMLAGIARQLAARVA
jgi:octaprenyl-diphosphate synthase